MSEKHVPVTQELIRRGRTGTGGWTKRQLELLGVAWPPAAGWARRVVGTLITREAADEFVALEQRSARSPQPRPETQRPLW